MLMVLARLGLRSPEVIAIQLDDIDWRNGTILIRGKGKRHDRMPLPDDVGKAIVDYIKNGRRGASRTLFVSHTPPHKPFVDAQILNTALKQAFEETGLSRRRSTSARTCSGTVSLPTCCARARRSTRSATCCGTAHACRRRSMRGTISTVCARSHRPGRRRRQHPAPRRRHAHDDADRTSRRVHLSCAAVSAMICPSRPVCCVASPRSRIARAPTTSRSICSCAGSRASARPTTILGRHGSAWCAASPAGCRDWMRAPRCRLPD